MTVSVFEDGVSRVLEFVAWEALLISRRGAMVLVFLVCGSVVAGFVVLGSVLVRGSVVASFEVLFWSWFWVLFWWIYLSSFEGRRLNEL